MEFIIGILIVLCAMWFCFRPYLDTHNGNIILWYDWGIDRKYIVIKKKDKDEVI